MENHGGGMGPVAGAGDNAPPQNLKVRVKTTPNAVKRLSAVLGQSPPLPQPSPTTRRWAGHRHQQVFYFFYLAPWSSGYGSGGGTAGNWKDQVPGRGASAVVECDQRSCCRQDELVCHTMGMAYHSSSTLCELDCEA